MHLLRRISFGPTAATLERLRAIGREAYIEEQLVARDGDVNGQALLLFPRIAERILLSYITTGTGFLTAYHVTDLQNARIYRAARSKAQLYEMMVEFWLDHFNIYIRNAPLPYAIDFDRDVIRVNAMGSFPALLDAVCYSACMQRYLDNNQNAVGAINENYARELMELHTLGRGGGYSEDDVKALAILLSGLELLGSPQAAGANALQLGTVRFNPDRHDPRAVTLLGHDISAGNTIERSRAALQVLVAHPSTARFVATKLCQRFISDDPPASAVDRVAGVYTLTGGDIKSMVRATLDGPEFAGAVGQKYKRPMHAVAGVMRACELNLVDTALGYNPIYPTANAPYQALLGAGAEPYAWISPDGLPDTRAHWANTSALLGLQKFFVRLSQSTAYGRLLGRPGTATLGLTVAAGLAKAKTPREAVTNLVANLLFSELPAEAMDVLVELQAQGADPDAAQPAKTLERGAAGVMLALLSSPWFMVR